MVTGDRSVKKMYRLLKEHRINRVLQGVGTELELPEQLGGWFVEQNIAEEVKPPAAPIAEAAAPVAAVEFPVPLADTSTAAPLAAPTPRFRCCGWNQ